MTVLDRATLNRTLLARQHLLARSTLSAFEMVEHLVAIQSQVPTSCYAGLWSRIECFRMGDLGELLLARRVVRLPLLRNTVHLVSGRDALAIRPVVRTLLEKDPYIKGVDRELVAARARALVEDEPRTPADLAALLVAELPESTPEALSHAARGMLALVQLPPRGVWGSGGAVRLTTLESWLGAPLGTDESQDALVLRYLRAFGPASTKDFAAWSRLTGVRAAFDRLRPELVTYRDEHGAELFDVPDGVVADASADAPVRLLPEYDNVLLAHADRSRILTERARTFLSRENGYWPFVLADGEVVARWTMVNGTLVVELFDDVADAVRDEIAAEARRWLQASDQGERVEIVVSDG